MPEDPSTSPESNPQNLENSEPLRPSAEPVAGKTESVPPKSPQPKTPVSVRVERSKTDEVLGQVSNAAQKFWQKAQPILKEKSIQALRASNRFTNHFLDRTWPKLSAQAIDAVPASTKAKVEAQKVKLQPTLDKIQPVWQKGVVPFWQNVVVPLWMKGLALLRKRLPITLAQELTDRFLTILVVSVLVTVYWFFSSLTDGKPATAKPAFPKPTSTPIVTRPVPAPLKPSASPKRAPVVTAQPSKAPSMSPSVSPAAQPSLASPKPTVPKPVIDLVEVRNQLANAVANVDPDLVSSVRSLESDRRLQATLGKTWFGLNAVAQDRAAQDLWKQAQTLKFERLELRDDSGNLVARSPVVGPNMIVFKRHDVSDVS